MTTWRYGDDEISEIFSLATTGDTPDRLPRWARERERQMEAIAEHAVKLLSNR
ncbi:MAG TPA: hypothetical protein VIJ16_06485 [Gemmatimonadaceae bacterium]